MKTNPAKEIAAQVIAAEADATRLANAFKSAKFLGISVRQLYRLNDAGVIPAPVRLGGCVRWDIAVLAQWVTDGCPDLRTRKSPRG